MPYIMTENGWFLLQPKCVNHVYKLMTYDDKAKKYVVDNDKGKITYVETVDRLPPSTETFGKYDGGFPSEDLCRFVNSMKDKMLHLDDGERMRYSKWGGRV